MGSWWCFSLYWYSYALNNPLIYTDPDGEFIQYIIVAIFRGISGYKIGKANGAEGWGLFWYTLGGAAVGTVAGHIGASVYASSMAASSAAGVGGFVAGANAGALSGLTSGMISGAGMGALRGGFMDAISKGMALGGLSGSIGGGLFGGIGNGIQSSKNNGNFWNGSRQSLDLEASGSTIDGGAFKFKSNDDLIQYAKDNGIDLDDLGVEQLSAFDNAGYESGNRKYWYERGQDGYMWKVNLKTGARIKLNGTTQMTDPNIFCRTSNIYMSRISDLREFTAALNHELIHSFHISRGLTMLGGKWSEYVATQYSLSVGYGNPSKLIFGRPWAPQLPPNLIPLN